MYINHQQLDSSIGLYAQKSSVSNNFKWAISKNKGVLHCKGYKIEDCADDIMDAPLSEPFLTKRKKMPGRPDGFMLWGRMGVDSFSTSEMLYSNMKIRPRLIRARPTFYTISDNPNVSIGIIDCSFYTRRIAVKGDFRIERLKKLACTPVKYNYLETIAKAFIILARHSSQHCSIRTDCCCNGYRLCIYWIVH